MAIAIIVSFTVGVIGGMFIAYGLHQLAEWDMDNKDIHNSKLMD